MTPEQEKEFEQLRNEINTLQTLKREVDALQVEVMSEKKGNPKVIALVALLLSFVSTFFGLRYNYISEVSDTKKEVRAILQHIVNFPIVFSEIPKELHDSPWIRESMLKNYYFLATLGHDLMKKHPDSFNPIEHIIILEALSSLNIYDPNFVTTCDKIRNSKIQFACSYANRILGNYYYYHNNKGKGAKHFSDALNIWEHHRDSHNMGLLQKIRTYFSWSDAELNLDNAKGADRYINKAENLIAQLNDRQKRGYDKQVQFYRRKVSEKSDITLPTAKDNDQNSSLSDDEKAHYLELLERNISVRKLIDILEPIQTGNGSESGSSNSTTTPENESTTLNKRATKEGSS